MYQVFCNPFSNVVIVPFSIKMCRLYRLHIYVVISRKCNAKMQGKNVFNMLKMLNESAHHRIRMHTRASNSIVSERSDGEYCKICREYE